jgi:hypothetical protein
MPFRCSKHNLCSEAGSSTRSGSPTGSDKYLTHICLLCSQAPTFVKFMWQWCQVILNNKRNAGCITYTAGGTGLNFECVTNCDLNFLKILTTVIPQTLPLSSYRLLVTSFHLMLILCVRTECLKSISEINIFHRHRYCFTRWWHFLILSVTATGPLKFVIVTRKFEKSLTTKQCRLHTEQHCLCVDVSMATTMLKHVFCLVLSCYLLAVLSFSTHNTGVGSEHKKKSTWG